MVLATSHNRREARIHVFYVPPLHVYCTYVSADVSNGNGYLCKLGKRASEKSSFYREDTRESIFSFDSADSPRRGRHRNYFSQRPLSGTKVVLLLFAVSFTIVNFDTVFRSCDPFSFDITCPRDDSVLPVKISLLETSAGGYSRTFLTLEESGGRKGIGSTVCQLRQSRVLHFTRGHRRPVSFFAVRLWLPGMQRRDREPHDTLYIREPRTRERGRNGMECEPRPDFHRDSRWL